MANADSQQKRKCPGEKYGISLAICLGRQSNRYPKCLLCEFYAGDTGDTAVSDPKVKPAIFRTTTISGVVPSDVDEYVMRKVGTAAAQYLRAESASAVSVVIGCDLRDSSRGLTRAFCEGANMGGLHTVSIGPAPPEVLRFTLATRKFSAAAFVGGCHAAEDVNGVRLYRADGTPLTFSSGLDKIGLIARRLKPGHSRNPGQKDRLNPLDTYCAYIQKFAPHLSPIKVVVDASCGIAARFVQPVLQKLPIEVLESHFDWEGRNTLLGKRFPAQEVQDALRAAVRPSAAQMGVAIDFDGDMVAFCDENGEMVPNDAVAALIAQELLNRTPNARIAYDLRFSGAVREEILKAGGQALRCRADPIALVATAWQNEAVYAADMVGRHFFRDLFGAESPMLATLLVCSALSRTHQPLSELIAPILRYEHSGELSYSLPSQEATEQLMESIRAEFPDGECDTLDGLTFRFAEWWFNLRRSPNAAAVKLNIEGRTVGDERRGRQTVERILRKHGARRTP